MLYDGYDDGEHVCTFKILTTNLGVTQNQSFISLMSHKNTLIVIWCMCCYHAVTILDTNLGVTQFLVICLKYHGKHVRCYIKYMFKYHGKHVRCYIKYMFKYHGKHVRCYIKYMFLMQLR